jgi:hypothetical protein
MKTMPERTTKIKELIREALTKKYNCSPVERADRLYADVECQFRKIHEQQVKNLNIPAVSNNEVAVAFGDWLRTQRADIFYGYPTTKKLFEMYKKATDC